MLTVLSEVWEPICGQKNVAARMVAMLAHVIASSRRTVKSRGGECAAQGWVFPALAVPFRYGQ